MKKIDTDGRMKNGVFFKKYIDIFRIDWLEVKRDMSLSVVIPCSLKHFYLLKNLLKIYRQQTVFPMEFIISISDLNQMNKMQREKFKKFKDWASEREAEWKIPIDIIFHPGIMLAGANKNCAISRASGDVIVVQDADDIPHIQRLEIIKFWFDHFDIVHLAHGVKTRQNQSMILAKDYQNLKFNQTKYKYFGRMDFYIRSLESWKVMPKQFRIHISNGGVAFLRSLCFDHGHEFDPTIPKDEDGRFNRLIEEKYRKSVNLRAPLIIYNKVDQVRNLKNKNK